MNFNDPMPYSEYDGRRDGGPEHIKALIRWQERLRDPEADAHVLAWEDYCYEQEELDAADAREAQWEEEREEQRALDRRQYLRSIGCNPDSPWA